MSATTANWRLKKPRIIVLEDSRLLSEIVRFCIQNWFWEADVTSFENGDRAWDELSRLAPDLLITDRMHPGLNGDELLWRLADQQVKFPILLLSGDPTCRTNLPPNLNLVSLSKPFNRDSLWLVLNELVGPCDFPAHATATERQTVPAKSPATGPRADPKS